jgi:hypothetical protein
MFSDPTETSEKKPNSFETGRDQRGNPVVKIEIPINMTNIDILITKIDEQINNFFSGKPITTSCKLIFVFDSYGDNFLCTIKFGNYIKSLQQRYTKLTFVGILEHAEGNVALMYMLLHERIVQVGGVVQTMGGMQEKPTSNLRFSTISNVEVKNEIAKLLLENKIKIDLQKLCFPSAKDIDIQYCGECIFNDGFGTVLQ